MVRIRVAILLVAGLTAGCASSGSVPRPRPFPGAALPPGNDGGGIAAAPPRPVAPGTPNAVIAAALQLRGAPYRNGGSDPSGFDCSGFVQWVFAGHGVTLPREVRDQYLAGEKVGRDEVRPGDLVFFETVSRGASHVGIALGGGEFVHAPSTRGVVRVERYTSDYWAQRWVGARRVMLTSTSNF